MENISSKTTKIGNVVYLNLPKNHFTKEEVLALFTEDVKFVVFNSSSKLNTKEDIINAKFKVSSETFNV